MNTLRIVLLGILALAVSACRSNDTTAPTTGEGAASGIVKDAISGQPIEAVSVSAPSTQGDNVTGQTDNTGKYTIKLPVDSTLNATVSFSRQGYRDTTITVKLKSGSTTTANLSMTANAAVTGGGGLPQTITFLSSAPPTLAVYGVGATETSLLTWEVRDSLGNAVDLVHPAQITFSIVGGPGGGEYISPSTMTTNATGRATVTLNAGTKAGVCQILATTSANGRTISSSPVHMVINGGFPDQAHFTIAVPNHNFPALDIVGSRLQVSVLIGDKYSNPASPSAVYFSSTAGVVQGTFGGAVTTSDGQGSVDLISGNPYPYGANASVAYGNGYNYVVARTIGQNGVTVQDSVLLVWSGGPQITNVSPATFDIPNTGSATIGFTVSDQLGHPLAAGTSIAVLAEIPAPTVDGAQQNKVFLSFGQDGKVELPDLLFPGAGSTNFTIMLQDGSWGLTDVAGTPVMVTITVTGPNTTSPIVRTITGVVH